MSNFWRRKGYIAPRIEPAGRMSRPYPHHATTIEKANVPNVNALTSIGVVDNPQSTLIALRIAELVTTTAKSERGGIAQSTQRAKRSQLPDLIDVNNRPGIRVTII